MSQRRLSVLSGVWKRGPDGQWVVRATTSRWVTMGGLLLIALIAASGFGGPSSTGSTIFLGVIVAMCLAVAVRAWRSGTLVIGQDEVKVRSLLRTRRWRRSAVQALTVDTRPVGAAGWRRRVLGLTLADGDVEWLSEINCRPPRGNRSSWIDEAIEAINRG